MTKHQVAYKRKTIWLGDTCDKCDQNSYAAWQVSNLCWEKVVGRGYWLKTVICLNCFFELAFRRNIKVSMVDFEILEVPLGLKEF